MNSKYTYRITLQSGEEFTFKDITNVFAAEVLTTFYQNKHVVAVFSSRDVKWLMTTFDAPQSGE